MSRLSYWKKLEWAVNFWMKEYEPIKFTGGFYSVNTHTIYHDPSDVKYEICKHLKVYKSLPMAGGKTLIAWFETDEDCGRFVIVSPYDDEWTNVSRYRVRMPDFEYFWECTYDATVLDTDMFLDRKVWVKNMLTHASKNVSKQHEMRMDMTKHEFEIKAVCNHHHSEKIAGISDKIHAWMEKRQGQDYAFLQHSKWRGVWVMPWTCQDFGDASLFVFFTPDRMLILQSDRATAKEAIRLNMWPLSRLYSLNPLPRKMNSPWHLTIRDSDTDTYAQQNTHARTRTYRPASLEINDKT